MGLDVIAVALLSSAAVVGVTVVVAYLWTRSMRNEVRRRRLARKMV